MGTVHIIGAGLAGLAAAIDLAKAGRAVVVHEAAGQAGGRCRSFHDDALGCEIDNGNHLMLSGNESAMAYLATIGARDTLLCPPGARIPFVDFATGQRWIVDINEGRLPWWIFAADRRVADSSPAQYLAALRLAVAGPARTVADCFDTTLPIYRRFWEPLTVAILNTAAEEASARLLWRVFVETVGRGAAASRPCIARDGLSHSLIDPALAYLERHKVAICFASRLRRLETRDGRAVALDLADAPVALGPDDRVILAVPPQAAVELLPGSRRRSRRGPSSTRISACRNHLSHSTIYLFSASSAATPSGCSCAAGWSRSRSARPRGWSTRRPRISRPGSGPTSPARSASATPPCRPTGSSRRSAPPSPRPPRPWRYVPVPERISAIWH